MLFIEDQVSDSRSRMKMRELARSCGWLSTMLLQQDRLMGLLDTLACSGDASSWRRAWTALEQAVTRHMRVEDVVLAPAIEAMGQRAHAVVARARREQIRRGIEELRWPSWEDEGDRVRQVGRNLASHFSQEESWSYQALARRQDDRAHAALTARCQAVFDGVNTSA